MSVRRKIVILTETETHHRYVAKALAELSEVAAIVVAQQRLALLKRVKRTAKRYGVFGALSRAILKLVLKVTGETSRRRADLVRVLGEPKFPDNVSIFRTVGVNSAQTRAVLRDLAPDILCVYGTPIVSDTILSIARIALNLHTGVCPRYRGSDCEFWALHEQELNFLGATVHACTPDVDGGAIFGIARAKLEANDGLGAVCGRCVAVGARLYKQVVSDLITGREIKAPPQDLSAGREYKLAMRGWLAEFRVARLIRCGLIRDYVAQSNNFQMEVIPFFTH